MSRNVNELAKTIVNSVNGFCNDPVTVSFSGGVDSALVAYLAAKKCKVQLIAVGTVGSHDIEAAKTAAKDMDLEDSFTSYKSTSNRKHNALKLAVDNNRNDINTLDEKVNPKKDKED